MSLLQMTAELRFYTARSFRGYYSLVVVCVPNSGRRRLPGPETAAEVVTKTLRSHGIKQIFLSANEKGDTTAD